MIDSPAFDGQGYDQDDMKKNGEHKLISELIENGDVVFDVKREQGNLEREGTVASRTGAPLLRLSPCLKR